MIKMKQQALAETFRRTLQGLLCILFFMASAHTMAQAPRFSWDDFVQELTADEELVEDEDWLSFVEELKVLHDSPLNINTASVSDLLRLPFLTEEQIEQIHAYIYLHGAMQSLGELRLVPLIDEQTRRWLSLFVFAGPAAAPEKTERSFAKTVRHSLSSRIDVPLYYRQGFQKPKAYAGNPLYQRVKYEAKGQKFAAGLRAEKDAGERRYFDSYGGYVLLHDIGHLQRAVVGDYHIGFGEGLVMGGDVRFAKNSPARKSQQGIRAMRSTDETRFLRGAAATMDFGQISTSLFVSHRCLDATLADGQVQTLLRTGYHRTASEINSKRSVSATVAGVDATWRQGAWQLGATGYWQTFSRRLEPGSATYRQIYPRGRQFGALSAHYGYTIYRLTLAGETAYSTTRGWATLHRANYDVSQRLKLHVVQRFFTRSFYSFHASCLSDASVVQNESGVLLHLWAEPWAGITLQTYADFFHHAWPRYRMTHSDTGQEFMTQVAWQTDRRNNFSARYQLKRKEVADQMEPHHRIKLRWAHTAADGRWSMRSDAFLHRVLQHTGVGVQESFRLEPSSHWRFVGTLAWFHTPNYLSRLYFYEPSLYESITSASYYGHGTHAAVTTRWSPTDHWMLEMRYGASRYFDRSQQGSGPQAILSPWRNDLSFQLRYRF